MYSILRPLLFKLEPESAHILTLNLMRIAGAFPPTRKLLGTWFRGPARPVEAFGLVFENPLGLAAGYDKDGIAWRGLSCLGFGHLEIGTVTPQSQLGNPKPRLFRLPEDHALINRLGFPSRGAEPLARRLSRKGMDWPKLGVNLGMNASTPLEEAVEDYLELASTFAPLADYLAINVSSPNTLGLRRLQARKQLEALLHRLVDEREIAKGMGTRTVPLLVKLSPDLNDDELDDALDVISRLGIDGVIAANTSLRRGGLKSSYAGETGGLSGAPLKEISTNMVHKIFTRTAGKLPVIGVGGVMDSGDVRAKLDAGAILVQIYTGLVYEGPGIVRRILDDLTEC